MINIHAHSYLVWAALVWGGTIIHLFVDWFLQNDWMAQNKAKRRIDGNRGLGLQLKRWLDNKYVLNPHWWDRHPAAYVHSGLHAVALLLLFPWWAALLTGVLHLLIDLRTPLTWWGNLFHQTKPKASNAAAGIIDVGGMVAFWRDQVAHIVVIALVALLVV